MAEGPGYTGEGNEVWRKGQDIGKGVILFGWLSRGVDG